MILSIPASLKAEHDEIRDPIRILNRRPPCWTKCQAESSITMLRDPFQILSDQNCCWIHDFLFGPKMGHDLFGEPRPRVITG